MKVYIDMLIWLYMLCFYILMIRLHYLLVFAKVFYQLLKLVRKNFMAQEKQKRFIAQKDLYLNPETDNYGCFGLFSFNSCSSTNQNGCLSQQTINQHNISGGSTPINLDYKIKQSLKKKQNSPSKRFSKQERKTDSKTYGQLPKTRSQRDQFNLWSMRESAPYMGNQSHNTFLRSSDHEIRLVKQKSYPSFNRYFRKSTPQNVINRPVQPLIYYSPISSSNQSNKNVIQKLQFTPNLKKENHKISYKQKLESIPYDQELIIQMQNIEKSTHEQIQQLLIQSGNIIEEIITPASPKKAQNLNELKIRKVDSIRDQDSQIEASIVLSRSPKQSISDGQSVIHNIAQSYFPNFTKKLLGTRH